MRRIVVSLLVILCYFRCGVHLFQLPSPQQDNHLLIYVNNSAPPENISCWTGQRQDPCKTLEMALEGVRHLSNGKDTKHPWVFLETGRYALNKNSSFSGPEIRDFGIVGSGRDVSIILCSPDAGFKFIDIEGVTIVNVTLENCGAIQETTNMKYTTVNSSESMEFWELKVGLYFLLCNHVSIVHVSMNHSNGIAMLVYSGTGLNVFESVYIYNSQICNDTYPAAGGLYIEFPYCMPGNCSVDGSERDGRIPGEKVSNAKYLISNSKFVGNIANISKAFQEDTKTFAYPRGVRHTSLGHGGGVSILFKGQASNNSIAIQSCEFTDNIAVWGGGLFVEHQDNSTGNNVTISSSTFNSNGFFSDEMVRDSEGVLEGGGAIIGYVFYLFDRVTDNNITFQECNFTGNSAYRGGGVSFYASRDPFVARATNTLNFVSCTWSGNSAQLGAAVNLAPWSPVVEGALVVASFTGETKFLFNNQDPLVPGMVVSIGALAINSIPTQFNGHVEFYGNHHTALSACIAPLIFGENCTVDFTGNVGRRGGAVFLENAAFIQVAKGARFAFKNNAADLNGGAIYSNYESIQDVTSSQNCFVRYSEAVLPPQEWAASFVFENNIARKENNSIYATTVSPCIWPKDSGTTGSTNDSAFCWDNWSYRWNGVEMECASQIRTDPIHFNVVSSVVTSFGVYPGISKLLPPSLRMLDDYGHSVNVVFVTSTNDKRHVSIANSSQYISDNSIKILGNPGTSDMIVDMYTLGSRMVYTQLNLTLLECPVGLSMSSGGYCHCDNRKLFKGIVKCWSVHSHDYSVNLSYHGYWVGMSDSKDYLVAGSTPYTLSHENNSFMSLKPDSSLVGGHLCGFFNRKGVLCGECIDGYSPAINSVNFKCIPCSAEQTRFKWLLYISTELLPPTLLFIVIMLFNISLTSEAANGFIFFSQAFTPIFTVYRNKLYDQKISLFYVTVYDVCNLNFFDSFEFFRYCIHPRVTAIQLIAMEYAVALYPLILVAILYFVVSMYNSSYRPIVCLCRPIHHCVARIRGPWNMDTSITHTLAAFLLLSFVKFTVTSYNLLSPSYLYNQSGQVDDVMVYFQGNMRIFRGTHIIYGSIAIVILIVFVGLPTILLLLFPFKWFHVVLGWLTFNRLVLTGGKIELFLNTYYGSFRDGTQGDSRDWRCFAGLYFVFRIVLSTVNTFNQLQNDLYIQQHLFCIVVCLLFATIRPYRVDFYNSVDAIIFGIMAMISVLSEYNFQVVKGGGSDSKTAFAFEVILMGLPLIYLFSRVWVKFVRPIRKKYFKDGASCAIFRRSNGTTSQGGGGGGGGAVMSCELENDDSLMKLIDDRAGMVQYYDSTSGSMSHSRNVQFSWKEGSSSRPPAMSPNLPGGERSRRRGASNGSESEPLSISSSGNRTAVSGRLTEEASGP